MKKKFFFLSPQAYSKIEEEEEWEWLRIHLPLLGDAGLIPAWGTNIPHAIGQLSLWATTAESLNTATKTQHRWFFKKGGERKTVKEAALHIFISIYNASDIIPLAGWASAAPKEFIY